MRRAQRELKDCTREVKDSYKQKLERKLQVNDNAGGLEGNEDHHWFERQAVLQWRGA